MDIAVPADHRVKLKEIKKKSKYLNFAREVKKLWNMKVTVITIIIAALDTVTKRLVKELEGLKIRGQVETIQTIALLKIRQNTKKSPKDFRTLAITQTPVRIHRLTLV